MGKRTKISYSQALRLPEGTEVTIDGNLTRNPNSIYMIGVKLPRADRSRLIQVKPVGRNGPTVHRLADLNGFENALHIWED